MDMVGLRFGRLVVTCRAGSNNGAMWLAPATAARRKWSRVPISEAELRGRAAVWVGNCPPGALPNVATSMAMLVHALSNIIAGATREPIGLPSCPAKVHVPHAWLRSMRWARARSATAAFARLARHARL